MTELPRDEHELPAMMRFVRDEIREHVTDVERQIAPDIARRRRDAAGVLEAEREQLTHRTAASFRECAPGQAAF